MSLAESLEAAAAEVLKASMPTESTPVAAEEPIPEEQDTNGLNGDAESNDLDSDTPEGDETSKDAPLPDGYVKVPTVTDKLATDFILRDAEGEVEVPELMVEYKANGKVRKDRLDQVVKLAQFGVYNEERERKVQQVEASVQSLNNERQQLTRLLEERESQLERMLTDDQFLMAVRDSYEQQNSPEARVQRAEQEAQTLRIERQIAPIFAQNEQFNDSEVVPALDTIVRALPSVTIEELEERLQMVALANAELAPTGARYIPPSRFDAIRKYIVEDLAVWAQIQHARRSESLRPSPELVTAKAETDKARVEAQRAKRLVGQATKPMASANAKVQPKKAKPAANVDEAQAQAEAEVLAAMGLR